MRTIFKMLIAAFVAPALAAAKPAEISGVHAAANVAAIERVVLSATMGWKTYDVAQAMSEYADDAYFFNAFGRERKGKAAIRQFVAQVLNSAEYRAGIKTPLEVRSIRFLRPDVAMVHTYWETVGQLNQGGAPIGVRRSHTFRTLEKRDGRWQTVSFLVSDERNTDPARPEPSGSKE